MTLYLTIHAKYRWTLIYNQYLDNSSFIVSWWMQVKHLPSLWTCRTSCQLTATQNSTVFILVYPRTWQELNLLKNMYVEKQFNLICVTENIVLKIYYIIKQCFINWIHFSVLSKINSSNEVIQQIIIINNMHHRVCLPSCNILLCISLCTRDRLTQVHKTCIKNQYRP